jgi:diguanylate cyclase (GGDEF)-like protein/PAS domain S-box-containing protein
MKPPSERLARRSHRWIRASWATLVLGVMLSVWLWQWAAHSTQVQADEALRQAATQHAQRLQEAVTHYTDLLERFRAALQANPQLDRLTFHQLYQGIDPQDHPGLVAVQYAKLVDASERETLEAEVRQDRSLRPEGYPNFQVQPRRDDGSMLPVVYIEPAAGNERALGYDQSADPVRREAQERARDTGQIQASAPVTLVSGAKPAVGFVLRLPLYRHGHLLDSVAARRQAFAGQVGEAVQAEGFVSRALPRSQWQRLHWRLVDMGPADPADPAAQAAQIARPAPTLLFDTAQQGESGAFAPNAHQSPQALAANRHTLDINLAGRHIQAELSRPPVNAPWQPYPLLVLGAGLLSTLGLWWGLRGAGTQQAEAAELARAMTQDARESAERLLAVMNSTRDALFTLDAQGQILSCNQAARQLFMLDEPASRGHIQQLLPTEPLDSLRDVSSLMAAHGLSMNAIGRRLIAQTTLGERMPVQVTLSPMDEASSASQERSPRYLLTARDLRDQVAAEQAYEAAQRQLDEVDEMRRVIVHHAPYAILVLNRSGVIQTMNPAGETLLGIDAHELVGRSTTQRFFDPDEVADRAKLLALRLNQPVRDLQVLVHLAEESPGEPSEWTLVRSDGRRIVAEISVTMLSDDTNQPTGYLAMAHDVSARSEAEQQLQHQAQHDALTGLPNRNMVQEQLKGALALCERNGTHLALMFLDMDRFKKINDTLGHHVGDSVIVEVAQRLRQAMRTSDIVARLGGDEFVILLPLISQAEDGERVAAKVLALFNEPLRIGPHELRITPSIGLVVYPNHGVDAGTLMRHADLAMYQAKNQGRNRVQVFNAKLEAVTADTLLLENDLYKAQARGELRLHFQPQFDCASGRIIGAEALLRWEHGGKLVPPMDFIPFAEETGLIVSMGEWVLQRACVKAQAWIQDTGWPLRVAVNLSAVQLDRDDIVETVARVLRETGLPPTALELEITETVVVRESLRAADILTQLRALGVSVAIDDFGVGYSSFGYLRELPVDRFKLDRSFLSAIPQSEGDCRLAAALIAMAHRLDVGIVAEGVETEEQYAFLKAHNCDEAQGYHLGRPLKEEAFEALLKAHAAEHSSKPMALEAPRTSSVKA